GRLAAEPAGVGRHGLVGMRERVAVHLGTFTAGPKLGGGWRVVAEVPWGSGSLSWTTSRWYALDSGWCSRLSRPWWWSVRPAMARRRCGCSPVPPLMWW